VSFVSDESCAAGVSELSVDGGVLPDGVDADGDEAGGAEDVGVEDCEGEEVCPAGLALV